VGQHGALHEPAVQRFELRPVRHQAGLDPVGIGGIVVRPAPRRAPRSRCEEVPTRRVTVDPESARADPSAVEASRLEARETVDMLLTTPAG